MRYTSGMFALALIIVPSAAVAADAPEIDRAVSRGVAALRALQRPDGRFEYFTESTTVGSTALAGLTLLQCGAAKEDPAVVSAARFVRQQGATLRYTYSIALLILFLDRLGDPADEPLITSLTTRLMAGQSANGGWDYECPDSSALDQQLQLSTVKRQSAPAGRGPDARAGGEAPGRDFPRRVAFLRQQLRESGKDMVTDNSITQFATLALWVARRHQLPVENALHLVDRRFRTSQNADGGWSYGDRVMRMRSGMTPDKSTPTMTCAGLLGLAVGYGSASDKADKSRDPTKDRVLQAGLKALSRTVGLARDSLPEAPETNGGFRVRRREAGRTNYFLWGLERVAVALSLTTIGNKDWYTWGSGVLVANQRADGLWAGAYGEGGVDTCFALLFLTKANLAPDLTSVLKGRVRDFGQLQLRADANLGETAANPEAVDVAKSPRIGKEPPAGVAAPSMPAASPNTVASNSEPKAGLVSKAPSVTAQSKPEAMVKPSPDKAAPARPDDKVAAPRPPAGEDRPAATSRLAETLLALPLNRQLTEIERLRDQKGAQNTEALAIAIHFLPTVARRKAREALAERLSRMKTETIAEYLKDDEPEIRRAAALAGALRGATQLVPQLIGLLTDRDALVSRAAYTALKELTGHDFGPDSSASDADRARAAALWSNWWKTHQN